VILDFLDVSYLKEQLDKLTNVNISLSDLRDAIIGSGSKSLTDIVSTISSQVDTKTSVIDSRLYNSSDGKSIYDWLKQLANTGAPITNFPAWFTNTTKTIDDIISKIDSKFSISNWIGKVGIGDGTNLASIISGTLDGVSGHLLGVAPDFSHMYAGGINYEVSEVSVTTTQESTTFSPALKFAKITNTGDVDAAINLNDSSGSAIPIPAHTGKWFLLPISALYYKTASGSTTLKIEGLP